MMDIERTIRDYLYRVSLKAVIRNDQGQVLVVKEGEDADWNLPGGGMDHGETLEQAMKRELHEEAGYRGELTMRLIAALDAKQLRDREVPTWQLRLIYEVTPDNFDFSVGSHAKEIAFVDPEELKNSHHPAVRMLYDYCAPQSPQ